MDYFAGLDVLVKETSVCIVDDAGKIVREGRVASEPETLLQVVTTTIYHFKRIGLEAGPLSQWLYSVLVEAGLPVICVETRYMRAVLKAQISNQLVENLPDLAVLVGPLLIVRRVIREQLGVLHRRLLAKTEGRELPFDFSNLRLDPSRKSERDPGPIRVDI